LDTAVTPEFLVAFRATPLEREETLVPHVQEHDFYVLRHPTGPTWPSQRKRWRSGQAGEDVV